MSIMRGRDVFDSGMDPLQAVPLRRRSAAPPPLGEEKEGAAPLKPAFLKMNIRVPCQSRLLFPPVWCIIRLG